MNKIFIFLFLLSMNLASEGPVLAQNGWFIQPSGTTQDLYTSCFINDHTGWVAGRNGIILKTTNGGNNWAQQYSDTIHIFSISFCNEKHGRAVGGKYHFTPLSEYVNISLQTTDGGANWSRGLTYSSVLEQKIIMIDSLAVLRIGAGSHWSGFVSDGYIFRSSNSGVNWIDVSLSNGISLYGFTSLYFLNNNTGWAIGLYTDDVQNVRRIYLKTENQGINWSIIRHDTINSYDAGYTGRLQFLDESNGFLYSNPNILKTTDGGISWNEFIGGGDFCFINLDTGWIINNSNQIVRTNDGGVSWNIQYTPSSGISNINFLNPETGWIVGSNGVILKTITGGLINIKQISGIIPTEFMLHQNYPNPFNPATNIKFSLPNTQYTVLQIFDITGKEVATLVNKVLQAGEYNYQFSIDNYKLGSGVYFYQLKAGDYVQTRKMMLTK